MEIKEKRIQCKRCKSYIPDNSFYCSFCGQRQVIIPIKEKKEETELRKIYVIPIYVTFKWKTDFLKYINKLFLFFYNVEKVINKQKGVIEKFISDKGMLVIFGIKEYREREPYIAVETAIKIKEMLIKTFNGDLEFGIGISSGWCFWGELEPGNYSSLSSIGDAINISSRLSSMGKNLIYITSHLMELIQGEFTNSSIGNVKLEGKTVEEEVFVVEKEEEEREKLYEKFIVPYIERKDFYEKVLNIVDKWKKGTMQRIYITGDAGIGKTLFIENLLKKIEKTEDFFCIKLYSNIEKEGEALHLFYEFLSNALKDIRVRVLRKYITTLISIIREKSELEERIKLRRFKFLLWDFIRYILRYKKVIFVWDDINYADESSLEVVKFILSREEKFPVLFLFSGRSVLEGLKNFKIYNFILRNFEFSETKTLLEKSFGKIEDSIAFEIHNLTGGIPFYIVQYIRSMKIRNKKPEKEEKLPSSLVHLALLPIQELENREKNFLELLSIAGEVNSEVPFELIFKKEYKELFSVLIRKEFLRNTGSRIIFKNPLIKEILYHSLSPNFVERTHREISYKLKDTKWGEENPYFIFYHALKGKNYETAWDFGIKTVNKLIKTGNISFALFILESLENDVLPNYNVRPLGRGDFYYLRGKVFLIKNELEKALQNFHKALLITEGEDAIKSVEIKLYLSRVYMEKANFSTSYKFLRELLEKEYILPYYLRLLTHISLASLNEKQGKFFDSLFFLRKANNLLIQNKKLTMPNLKYNTAELMLWTGNIYESKKFLRNAEEESFYNLDIELFTLTQKLKFFTAFIENDIKTMKKTSLLGSSYAEKLDNILLQIYFNIGKIYVDNNLNPDNLELKYQDKIIREPSLFYIILSSKEGIKKIQENIKENPRNLPFISSIIIETLNMTKNREVFDNNFKSFMERLFNYPSVLLHILVLKIFINYSKDIENYSLLRYLIKNYLVLFEDTVERSEKKDDMRKHPLFSPDYITV